MHIKKKINNFTVIFNPSGAIFILELGILVISDLHIGKSHSIAKRGNFLPPFDIDDTIGKIKSNIDHYNPKKIISLGDSFHESDTLNIISENHIKILKIYLSFLDTFTQKLQLPLIKLSINLNVLY